MERQEIMKKAFNLLRDKGFVRSQRDFASLMELNESTISKALRGDERYLTDSLMDRLDWLMKRTVGIHSYVDTQLPQPSTKHEFSLPLKEESVSLFTLPVIPTKAMAGTLGEFTNSIHEYDCEQMISPIKGADYAIKVCGDSMNPEIPNGSQILIKKILEEQFIEWGKVFCLDTQNGAIIKKVFPTTNPEVVECRSVNPEFPPFQVNVKYINGWYRVLMVLSMK